MGCVAVGWLGWVVLLVGVVVGWLVCGVCRGMAVVGCCVIGGVAVLGEGRELAVGGFSSGWLGIEISGWCWWYISCWSGVGLVSWWAVGGDVGLVRVLRGEVTLSV